MKELILSTVLLLSACCFVSAKQNNPAAGTEHVVLNDSTTLSFSVYRIADRFKRVTGGETDYPVTNGVSWPDTLESGIIAVGTRGNFYKAAVPAALQDTSSKVTIKMISATASQREGNKSLGFEKFKFVERIFVESYLSVDAYIPGEYTLKIDCDPTQQHFENNLVISDTALCYCPVTTFREDEDSLLTLTFITAYPHTLTTEQLRALSVPYMIKQEASIIKKDTLHLDDMPALPERSAVMHTKVCENMSRWTPGEYTFNYVDPFNGLEVQKTLQVMAAPDTTAGLEQIGTTFTYTATSKLPETTDFDSPGIYVNAFGYATIVSHTFKDGVGKVVLNKTIRSFDGYAFYQCSDLTSITIPDSVTLIDKKAFAQCTNLRSVVFPDDFRVIMSNAFEGCINLKSVTFPKQLVSIYKSAFHGCKELTSVTIPESVSDMGNSVFSGCESLVEIKVEPGNTNYDSRNNCNAIIVTDTKTLTSGCIGTIIPEDVTTINPEAFASIRNLESIRFPASVTDIGTRAFSDCVCLSEIISEATTPPHCGRTCFMGVDNTIPVYVPVGTKALYEAADQWKDFLNIIEGKPGTTALKDVIDEKMALKVRKTIENGQIVIIRDGRRYNLTGIEL